MRRMCQVTVRRTIAESDCLVSLFYHSFLRILRAFLVEEAKIVKRVIKSQQKK